MVLVRTDAYGQDLNAHRPMGSCKNNSIQDSNASKILQALSNDAHIPTIDFKGETIIGPQGALLCWIGCRSTYCINMIIDTQAPSWHTRRRKKQLLIFFKSPIRPRSPWISPMGIVNTHCAPIIITLEKTRKILYLDANNDYAAVNILILHQ